jgi:hypothetical protein
MQKRDSVVNANQKNKEGQRGILSVPPILLPILSGAAGLEDERSCGSRRRRVACFRRRMRDLLRVAFSTHIFSLAEPKDCQFGAECALPITNEAGEVERRLQIVLQILSRRNPGLPSAYARQ